MRPVIITHTSKFGTKQELQQIIDKYSNATDLNSNEWINIAYAYHILGQTEIAYDIIKSLRAANNHNNVDYDIKLEATAMQINRSLNKYREAYDALYTYFNIVDSLRQIDFEHKITNTASLHSKEIENLHSLNAKNTLLIKLSIGLSILVLIVLALFWHLKSTRIKKRLIEEQLKIEKITNEKLQAENENIASQNKNKQLEHDKMVLEAENLRLHINDLEAERDNLKFILSSKTIVSDDVKNAVQNRFNLLNALLTKEITEKEQHYKHYQELITSILSDKNEFMNNNRLAITATNSQFMQYLTEHELTEDETNIVCLYAIGLRGKDIISYTNRKSHIHQSCAIRKKLGIDTHDTNLSNYIRNLIKRL